MQNKNPGDIISGAYDVRDRIRTHDLLVRSQTLYPTELHAHKHLFWRCLLNAGDRNRTGTVLPQQDFKSCASASSATPAFLHQKLMQVEVTGLEPVTLCL